MLAMMGARLQSRIQSRIANDILPFFALICMLFAGGISCTARADDSSFHWKSIDGAQLKLDEKIPLAWNVYQPDKKKDSNLVLVLLGRRYILLDSKAKVAYVVLTEDLHAQGQDFNSANLAIASHVIPSTAWSQRDIGPAEQIELTLEDYGRTLSVQLPHPLDLRMPIY
jgi:hypothetical protein